MTRKEEREAIQYILVAMALVFGLITYCVWASNGDAGRTSIYDER